jgi:MFS transporter, DHA1 family, multidrug resistance protein
MSHWKRNLIVLCVAQTITQIGFSAYQPFLPYYVQALGVKDYGQAARWMALFDTSAALAMMVFAPLWGALADRYGRKLMLMRATAAGSVLACLMAAVGSPGQLVVLRTLQGAFCGSVAAAITLVATETPEEKLGQSLGIMQTTQFVGQATGPLVGGILADVLGYRAVFPVSAALMLIALVSIALLVREQHRPLRPKVGGARLTLNPRSLAAVTSRNTLVLLLVLACNSLALAVLSPVLALYIKSLNSDSHRLGTLAGSIISISSLTCSVSALFLGHLGDRYGRKRILLCCVIGSALIYIPQSLARSAMQLLALRAIQGVFMGGISPIGNALLARSTPHDRRGTVFGLVSSASSGVGAVGPMLGATVASAWGMASTFWVTAGLFALIAALVGGLVHEQPQAVATLAEAIALPVPAGGSNSRKAGG